MGQTDQWGKAWAVVAGLAGQVKCLERSSEIDRAGWLRPTT